MEHTYFYSFQTWVSWAIGSPGRNISNAPRKLWIRKRHKAHFSLPPGRDSWPQHWEHGTHVLWAKGRPWLCRMLGCMPDLHHQTPVALSKMSLEWTHSPGNQTIPGWNHARGFHSNRTAPKTGQKKKKFIIGNINSTKNKSRFESSKNSMMTKHPTSKDTMEMHPPRGRRIRIQGYPPLLRELKISRDCTRPWLK